jgi:hypothetical protein
MPTHDQDDANTSTIVITQEMVDRATKVLHGSGLLEYCSRSDRLTVEHMLRAAFRSRQKQ